MQSASRPNRVFTRLARALMLGPALLALPTARAVAQAAEEQVLPPIVVQGATLEAPPAKPKPRPRPAPGGGAPSAVPAPAQGGVAGEPAAGEPVEVEAAAGSVGTGEAMAGIPAARLGTAVSVVTGEELRAQQIRHAADALRSLPGVSVSQQGGSGNVTVVRLRGGESNHTLVLIDGVEVNSGIDGFFDFANLTTEDIEQIEVLRGPQSGLYGSNAVSGVINIITKSGRGPLTVRAKTEGGSFGTRDGSVQVTGGNDRAHGALTLHGRATDGFNIAPQGNELDGSSISTFSFNGGVRVFDNLKIDGSLRRSRLQGDRDGFEGLLNGFIVSNDDLSTFDNKILLGRLDVTLDTLDSAWTHRLRITGAERDTTDNDRGSFPIVFHAIDQHVKYGYTSTYRLEAPQDLPVRHFFTGLIEEHQERFEQPSDGDFARERSRLSFAGEVRGEYFDRFFLGASVRHDDNDTFDDFTSWRGQGAWKLPGDVFRLHSSVGTGVKYPSFAELFGSFFRFVPNPNLVPETSLGWDAGVETTLLGGRAVIDVTYFSANLQNEITEDFSLFPIISAINLEGESTRKGIEVAARYKLIEGVTIGGAYTWLDARDDLDRPEIRRPRNSGRVDLDWAFLNGRGRLHLAAIYNGVTEDVAFNIFDPALTRVTLDDYVLVSAAASYQLEPGIELFGRVENLLDQDYQEVFGYETAGVAAFAGVRFTYEEPTTAALK